MHQVIDSIDAYDRLFLETAHDSTKVLVLHMFILTLTCGISFYQSDGCILQVTLFIVA
jgi:hypothetical protein